MNCAFEKIIVVGSGMLTHKIAVFLQNQGISVMVLEKDAKEESFVNQLCMKSGLPYRSGNSRELCKHILANELCPTLIISAANLYIFPPTIVNRPNIKIINYHNSKLPNHRGMNAEAWQIFDMETEAGVTWHFIDEQIDKGNIIVQDTIALNDSITSLKLLKLQSVVAYDLFLGFCESLLNGTLVGTPQDIDENTVTHYSKDIPNSGVLELCWDYSKISAFLRAMDYGPMKTLGSGKIVIDQIPYCWEGYEFENQIYRKTGIYMEDDRILIHKEHNSVVLKKCRIAEMP